MPSAKSQIALWLFTLLAFGAVGLVAFGAVGCAGDLPESRVAVPRLPLSEVMISGVLRAYGQPRQQTVNGLWYVGPGPQSLTHGQFGWMTLLSFGPAGWLATQEFLDFSQERDYLTVDYWISGDLSRRQRDLDLDQMLIARGVVLANSEPDYIVTTQQPDLFVLSRRLPGGNEPVVQCRLVGDGERTEVTATVRALRGRDDALIDAMRGAIEKRMLLIEIVNDTYTPATAGQPAMPQ